MRKEIASYGASGKKVRLLDETCRDIRYVRVQWRQSGRLRTQSWPYSRDNLVTARQFAQGVAEGRVMPPKRDALTLAQGWAAYAAGEFPRLRPRTQTLYRDRWLAFQVTFAHDKLCEDVDGTNLDAFVKKSRARGVHDYELQQILGGVKRLLRWLLARKLIKTNYVEGYEFRSIEIRVLGDELEFTLNETRLLLAQFDPSKTGEWRPWGLINLLGHQGVRGNAALHLKWDDVDLENSLITWRGEYDKMKQTWLQPLRPATVKSFEVALAMRNRYHYVGPWVFFSSYTQRACKSLRTAEPGTYRIQSLHTALLKAETRANVPHETRRAFHGFRRMVAGEMYEATGQVELAMEFINDTSAMSKLYILRRKDRLRKTAAAADASGRVAS
jgi:integrase